MTKLHATHVFVYLQRSLHPGHALCLESPQPEDQGLEEPALELADGQAEEVPVTDTDL